MGPNSYAVLLDGKKCLVDERGVTRVTTNRSSSKRDLNVGVVLLVSAVVAVFVSCTVCALWQVWDVGHWQKRVTELEEGVAWLRDQADWQELRSQLKELAELKELSREQQHAWRGQPTSADEDHDTVEDGFGVEFLEDDSTPESQRRLSGATPTQLKDIPLNESEGNLSQSGDGDEGEEFGVDSDTVDDSSEEEEEDVQTLTRPKRQVDMSAHTQDGIPIFDQGYGLSINRTEGLRIYQSLLATGERSEPKATDATWATTDAPIQPHHRQNRFWPEATTAAPSQARSGIQGQAARSARTKAPSVVVRHSRVKTSQEPPTPPPIQGDQKSLTQPRELVITAPPATNTAAAASVAVPEVRHSHSRQHKPRKTSTSAGPQAVDVIRVQQPVAGPADRPPVPRQVPSEQVQSTVDKKEYRRPSTRKKSGSLSKKQLSIDSRLQQLKHAGIWAAHLIADGRNATYASGDNAVELASRNELGLHTSWRHAPTLSNDPGSGSRSLRPSTFVKLDGATVSVRQAGLYFIYAQVHYLDPHPVNGYEVFVNTEPFLRCMTTTGGDGKIAIPSTCYTAGAVILKEGDKVFVRDTEPMRYSVLQPSKTFFGLARLAGIHD